MVGGFSVGGMVEVSSYSKGVWFLLDSINGFLVKGALVHLSSLVAGSERLYRGARATMLPLCFGLVPLIVGYLCIVLHSLVNVSHCGACFWI